MKIARMLCPVHSLGPGERVCLWTQGCRKNCFGCTAPELQPDTGPEIDETALARIITAAADRAGCTGLTVSGGDPFEQSPALLKFLSEVRERFSDILVYTGYTIAEIRRGDAGEAGTECLRYIDVLIDGRYIDSLNKPGLALRGSENQKIIFLSPEKETDYREYMKGGKILETFTHGPTAVVTGIPDRDRDRDRKEAK